MSGYFEQARRAHAAADAHRHHHQLGAAALALDQRVADEARAAHAVGVAERDRAAVDVEALVGNADVVAAIEHLYRERLVQLHRSMSATRLPAFSSSFGTANTGPMPISRGSQPAAAKPRKMPSGCRPRLEASFALMTTAAE